MDRSEDDDTNRDCDALAPGLIHEMRHPLMGIKAGLHYLERALPAATTGGDDWQMVKGQVARLEELFRRYQDFLHPEQVRPGPFPAGPVVKTAADLLRHRLKSLGPAFTLSLPEDSVLAVGTASVLTHAVTNLMLNAADALEEVGGGRLAVRLGRSPDGARVTVRVSDEGVGVSSESAARLFTEGYTTKAKAKGSGLGLKLARRLLAAQGGTLALVGDEDPERLQWAKTEFLATLPAAAPPVPSSPTPELRRAPPAAEAAVSPRALLVDDEPVILAMVGRAMAAEGYAVTSAATGDEAAALLRSQHFDLLITDKNLPGKTGVALATLARGRDPRMVIFLITGYATKDSARALLATGIDGYVEKPFELDVLAERVRAAAAARRAPPPDEAAGEAPHGFPRRVLVCDPDAAGARHLSAALTGLGMQAVPGGDPALGLRASPPPGGIVVATRLLTEPVRRALWEAKAARQGFRVVVILDDDSLADSIAAVAAGATGELTRPLDPERLVDALLSALQAPGTR